MSLRAARCLIGANVVADPSWKFAIIKGSYRFIDVVIHLILLNDARTHGRHISVSCLVCVRYSVAN